MNVITIILVVAVLAVYLVVRQFTQQVVTWRTLLLLPLVAIYGCYSELNEDFSHFAPTLLIVSVAVGILPGLLSGIFRGKHTRVSLNSENGNVYSKPELASSLTWLGLLIVHIAAIALSYTLLKDSLPGALLTAFAASLVLFNVVAQKFMLYQQYNRFQMGGMPQQFNNQRNR